MGRRFKGSNWKPPFPRDIGPRQQREIDAGAPWLAIWHYQLAVPLQKLARKSKITYPLVNQLVRGHDEPTRQEMEAIATALGTTAEMLNASWNVVQD